MAMRDSSDAERPLRILQVSTADIAGGAEKVAWDLFQSYRARGYRSWLAVGRKLSDDSDVLPIPRAKQASWTRFWLNWSRYVASFDGRIRGAWRASDLIRAIGEPVRWLDDHRGIEDFRFAGSWKILGLSPQSPDIVHLHNLHGGYFDLRVLPKLSQQAPVLLTLHDAWLLSGHCAHSFDCERWKMGCGQCPDLAIYPAIRRDATAYNWRRKRAIFARSQICVATPSRWLMQKVKESMLAPAIKEARVIPHGIDLGVFCPASKQETREALRLPQDAKILLFAANGTRHNIFKDYTTMQAAVRLVDERLHNRDILFIALGGDNSSPEQIGPAHVRFIPYEKDPKQVARYYQAADLYVHAARADTFPRTILEALACGTPVVATGVGGIPEQIKSLLDGNSYDSSTATGIVTPGADPGAMAAGIEMLLLNESLRQCLATNAFKDAQERFDLDNETNSYLEWYMDLLQSHPFHHRDSVPGASLSRETLSETYV
jgi:glycosyltransferase involved in cell wall biosynthesis